MATHTNTRVLSAGTLLGDTVRNNSGEELGTLEEIMLDLDSGRIAYAVLSFGGFLGFGDKLFAIPWQAMTVDTDNKEIILPVTKEQLENAPGFDPDNWPSAPDRSWVAEVHSYYGIDPYWK
jgi:sporulation protein YlmC with PRC-barrel domain